MSVSHRPPKGRFGREMIDAVQARDKDALERLAQLGGDPTAQIAGEEIRGSTTIHSVYTFLVAPMTFAIKSPEDFQRCADMLLMLLTTTRVPLCETSLKWMQNFNRFAASRSPDQDMAYQRVLKTSDAVYAYQYIYTFYSTYYCGDPQVIEKHGDKLKELGKLKWLTDQELRDPNAFPNHSDRALLISSFRMIQTHMPELYAEMMHDASLWRSPEDAARWVKEIGGEMPKEYPLPPAWLSRAGAAEDMPAGMRRHVTRRRPDPDGRSVP